MATYGENSTLSTWMNYERTTLQSGLRALPSFSPLVPARNQIILPVYRTLLSICSSRVHSITPQLDLSQRLLRALVACLTGAQARRSPAIQLVCLVNIYPSSWTF